jgi:hypothetical protein
MMPEPYQRIQFDVESLIEKNTLGLKIEGLTKQWQAWHVYAAVKKEVLSTAARHFPQAKAVGHGGSYHAAMRLLDVTPKDSLRYPEVVWIDFSLGEGQGKPPRLLIEFRTVNENHPFFQEILALKVRLERISSI